MFGVVDTEIDELITDENTLIQLAGFDLRAEFKMLAVCTDGQVLVCDKHNNFEYLPFPRYQAVMHMYSLITLED